MFLKKSGYVLVFSVLAGVLLAGTSWGIVSDAERAKAPRVPVGYAHEEVTSGKALLVCAYPDVEVCAKIMLKGAINLKELEARLPSLKKDQEIIFYCA